MISKLINDIKKYENMIIKKDIPSSQKIFLSNRIMTLEMRIKTIKEISDYPFDNEILRNLLIVALLPIVINVISTMIIIYMGG